MNTTENMNDTDKPKDTAQCTASKSTAEIIKETQKEPLKEEVTRLKIKNTCFQLEQALAEFEKENSLPNRDLQEKIRIQHMRAQLAAIREQIETLS